MIAGVVYDDGSTIGHALGRGWAELKHANKHHTGAADTTGLVTQASTLGAVGVGSAQLKVGK